MSSVDEMQELLREKYWVEGLSSRKIAEELRVTHGTILSWMKKYRISRRSKYRWKLPTIDPVTPPLTYLLGVLKGDGCVCRNRFLLQQTRYEFAISVEKALRSVNLNPNTSSSIQITSFTPRGVLIYRTSACSKVFAEWCRLLSLQDLRKMIKNSALAKEFIRGFYESEGTSGKYRGSGWTIGMCGKDRDLILFVQETLVGLGFNFKLGYSSKKDFYRIRSHRHEQNSRFIEEIKPCIKNKTHDLILEPWNKEKVIGELVELQEKLGRPPSIRDARPKLRAAAFNHFGTWNQAKRAAGLMLYPQGPMGRLHPLLWKSKKEAIPCGSSASLSR